MTLGEYIAALEAVPDRTRICAPGLSRAHSWRGRYEELAFEPVAFATVGQMLAEARAADGHRFHGYKGGAYVMTRETEVHVESWGKYTDGAEVLRFIGQYSKKSWTELAQHEEVFLTRGDGEYVRAAVDLMLCDVLGRPPLPPDP